MVSLVSLLGPKESVSVNEYITQVVNVLSFLVIGVVLVIMEQVHLPLSYTKLNYDVNIKLLKEGLMPFKSTSFSNGYDCRLELNRFNKEILGDKLKHCRNYSITEVNGVKTLILKEKGKVIIPLGFKLELPKGIKCKVLPKSGIGLKSDLFIPNSPGLVDTDYRGEVMLILTNLGGRVELREGASICQLSFETCPNINLNVVDNIDINTDRGSNGHGSTGSALDGGLGNL